MLALYTKRVFRYFSRTEWDIEATRKTLTSEAERKLIEARALREQDEVEAQKAEERLSRVRRDYQDGKLAADDWAEQREQLTNERDAAKAELERMQERENAEEQALQAFNASDVLTEHLARLRAAVSGEIKDAEGIEQARAAILKLFASFKLVPSRISRAGAMRRGVRKRVSTLVILPELRRGIVCLPRSPEELAERWLAEDSSEHPDNSACSKVRAHADHGRGLDRL